MIVGRDIEKEKLRLAMQSHRSELIAVYGRRRIGKTYLIREYFSKNCLFSFSGLRKGIRSDQLLNFMLELREYSGGYHDILPQNWLEAFNVLKQYLKRKRKTKTKKVIFIDEFPWVDTARSGFLPAFENFWNTYCTTRKDLIVVICGSAASYMIKKIIHNRGGLHNRITREIKLKPFDLGEVKSFFQYKKINIPDIEILKIYMAFGGVAEYLEHVEIGDSSVTAIDRLCFQKRAQFEKEFDEVFKSLFEEGSYHEQIIKVLAAGPKKGMTRNDLLNKKRLTSGGQFSKSLAELIESGFVEKYQSYRSERKTTLFRIFDEFCLFHLKFIQPFKGNSWSNLFTKNEYTIWCGHAFELICYKQVESIKKALHCDQIVSNNYSWSNPKAQIDLVIDRDDNVANLCEIKFYSDKFVLDSSYAAKLRNKENQYKKDTGTKKGVNTVMITTWGITGVDQIGLVTQSITIEALFR